MEYSVFKIPRADITIYLSLPFEISQKLIKERNKKAVRAYAGNKKDVHEVSLEYQKNSRESALWLSKTQKKFIKVDCAQKGEILSREAIHEMVYKEVKKIIK
jgi:dTMP kinase